MRDVFSVGFRVNALPSAIDGVNWDDPFNNTQWGRVQTAMNNLASILRPTQKVPRNRKYWRRGIHKVFMDFIKGLKHDRSRENSTTTREEATRGIRVEVLTYLINLSEMVATVLIPSEVPDAQD
jgi:hypothetical protein